LPPRFGACEIRDTTLLDKIQSSSKTASI
jgi:hypothetical protein